MNRRLVCMALAALLLCAALCGCSSAGGPDIEEIKTILTPLLDASFEINDIFFGAGLKSYARDSAYAAINMLYEDDDSLYDFVAKDAAYLSISELREAAEKVYSDAYLGPIYTVTFDGYYDDNGRLYPRYRETEEGLKILNTYEPLNIGARVFDYGSMTVLMSKPDAVNVAIDSYPAGGEGGAAVKYTLRLVLEEDGWRLDSPTY